MGAHRTDPEFVRVFVIGFHRYNIDRTVGKPLLSSWDKFVKYMQQNGEYTPIPTRKAAKYWYSGLREVNKWSKTRTQALKSIKTWLTEQFSSRSGLSQIGPTEPTSNIFPPQIVEKSEEKEANNSDISMDQQISPIIQVSPKNNQNNNQQNFDEILSDQEDINITTRNFPSFNLDHQMQHSFGNNSQFDFNEPRPRKKRPKKRDKEELDESDSEVSEEIRITNSSSYRQQKRTRAAEEGLVNYTRNQKKLQALGYHTGKVVNQLVKAAVPSIMENNVVNEILKEDKEFRNQQMKANKIILQRLASFQDQQTSLMSILNEKLDKVSRMVKKIKTEEMRAPPAKKRCYNNFETDFENDFDF